MMVVGKDSLSPQMVGWSVECEALLNNQPPEKKVSSEYRIEFTAKMMADWKKDWPEFDSILRISPIYGVFGAHLAESGAKRYIFSHVE